MTGKPWLLDIDEIVEMAKKKAIGKAGFLRIADLLGFVTGVGDGGDVMIHRKRIRSNEREEALLRYVFGLALNDPPRKVNVHRLSNMSGLSIKRVKRVMRRANDAGLAIPLNPRETIWIVGAPKRTRNKLLELFRGEVEFA